MEHLWRDVKLQLQSRASEWELERSALYQELGKLRASLRSVGVQPVPPSLPPTNLAVALRTTAVDPTPEEAPTGGLPPAPAPAALPPSRAVSQVPGTSCAKGGLTDAGFEALEKHAGQLPLDGAMSSAALAANVAALSDAREQRASSGVKEAQGEHMQGHACSRDVREPGRSHVAVA